MTASENNSAAMAVDDQAQANPVMAGFSTGRAPVKKTGSRGANMDAVNHLAAIAAEAAEQRAGAPKLTQDFDGTEFMRLLAMLYGIHDIPTPIVPLLNDFKLQAGKEKPTTADGTLYATYKDTPVEITRDTILTDEGRLTPELAYKMAAAASLNPNFSTLILSGTPEERMTLFLAAKHFNIEIDESSIPTITTDKAGPIAAAFVAFEKSTGLDRSTAEEYLHTPAEAAPAAGNDKTATSKKAGPERQEPYMPHPFVPMMA